MTNNKELLEAIEYLRFTMPAAERKMRGNYVPSVRTLIREVERCINLEQQERIKQHFGGGGGGCENWNKMQKIKGDLDVINVDKVTGEVE